MLADSNCAYFRETISGENRKAAAMHVQDTFWWVSKHPRWRKSDLAWYREVRLTFEEGVTRNKLI